jgi:hypothetical protein
MGVDPMKRIMFDVDGVLADFVKAYTTEAVAMGLLDQIITTPEQPEWSFEGVGLSKEAGELVWNRIEANPGWWYTQVESMISEHEARRINGLMLRNQVYFVTNRYVGNDSLNVQLQTSGWLGSIGIANASVITTASKGDIAKALRITHAVEDNAENAVAIAQHVSQTYMYTRKYNELVYFPHRVKTLKEFLDIVEA